MKSNYNEESSREILIFKPIFGIIFLSISIIFISSNPKYPIRPILYTYFILFLFLSLFVLFVILKRNKSLDIPFSKGISEFFKRDFSVIIYMLSLFYIVLFLPINLVLLFSGVILVLISLFLVLHKKTEKRTFLFQVLTGLLIIIVASSNIFPEGLIYTEADFITDKDNVSITFMKQDKRATDNFQPFNGWDNSQKLFRSLLFIGIKTDMNYDAVNYNYDQANLSISVEVSQFFSDTNSPFYKTYVNLYLIAYDTLVKDRIQESRLKGYDLLSQIESLKDVAEFYTTNGSETSCIIEAPQIKMGDYLLVIDFVIFPIEENRDLYEEDTFEEFDHVCNIYIEGKLNYGYTSQSTGYAYIIKSLNPKPTADSLFDDLIGEDIWNLAILFMILFFISVVLSFVQRDIGILRIVNLLLGVLWVIGLFSVIASGMNSVPDWLTYIMPEESASYLWGIIEAVKYSLIMGVIMAMIYQISNYLTITYEATINQVSL